MVRNYAAGSYPQHVLHREYPLLSGDELRRQHGTQRKTTPVVGGVDNLDIIDLGRIADFMRTGYMLFPI